MNPMPPAKKFERWHIDILGPLYKTNEEHEYILLCVDAYSKWVEGFSMKSQTAEKMLRFYFEKCLHVMVLQRCYFLTEVEISCPN